MHKRSRVQTDYKREIGPEISTQGQLRNDTAPLRSVSEGEQKRILLEKHLDVVFIGRRI